MLAAGGILNSTYLVSAIAAGLVGVVVGLVPFYVSWRRRRDEDLETNGMIREEVLGRAARDGMPARPGLSEVIRAIQADLRKSVEMSAETREEMRSVKNTQHDQGRRVDDHDKRLNTHDLKLALLETRLNERNGR